MMTIKKMKLSFLFILPLLYVQSASSFDVGLTNATKTPVMVDLYGVPFGSMMQGKIKNILNPSKKIWSEQKEFGNTTYTNAGAVTSFDGHSKPIIQPGDTLILKFNNIDALVCFDFANVKVGIAPRYSLQPREVKFVDNEGYDEAMKAAANIGKSISKAGEGAAGAGGKEGAIAGAALTAIGGIWKSSAEIAKGSGCRNISGVIMNVDPNNPDSIGLVVRRG